MAEGPDWSAFTEGLDLGSVHERMRAALAGRGSARDRLGLYGQIRYHLGWEDEAGRPVEERTGKGIRPMICLAACAATGAPAGRAVGMAAAIELTHEFSLIHDDIEDGDRRRRGRPALWTLTGEAQAINAGDALFSIARMQIGAEADALSAETVLAAFRRYDAACLELAEGQYLDIAFERSDAVDLDAYLLMVEGKTGALLGASAALGALSGGADEKLASAFDAYGRALGLAFQMQDDVLGIWGDPQRTGKPAGNDMRRRKRSLPVLLAWRDAELAGELQAIYAREGPMDEARLKRLIERMERAGIRREAQAMARRQRDAAGDALAPLEIEAGPKSSLFGLLRLAVDRDR